MLEAYAIWERKVPLPPPMRDLSPGLRWHQVAHLIRDCETDKGHGPGTTFSFLDHVPGPYAVEYPPGRPEPHLDERKIHRDMDPQPDWGGIFDCRDYYILNFKPLEPNPET